MAEARPRSIISRRREWDSDRATSPRPSSSQIRVIKFDGIGYVLIFQYLANIGYTLVFQYWIKIGDHQNYYYTYKKNLKHDERCCKKF